MRLRATIYLAASRLAGPSAQFGTRLHNGINAQFCGVRPKLEFGFFTPKHVLDFRDNVAGGEYPMGLCWSV